MPTKNDNTSILYNIFTAKNKYDTILKEELGNPLIKTIDGTLWNISPAAVRNLKFKEHTIVFDCTIHGELHHIIIAEEEYMDLGVEE